MSDVEKIRGWLDGCTGFHCEACMDEGPSECHGSRDGMIVEKMCRILLDACEEINKPWKLGGEEIQRDCVICDSQELARDAIEKCAKVIE